MSCPSELRWGNGVDQAEFQCAHNALANDYFDRLDNSTRPEEAGPLILQFILEEQRLRRGVVDPSPDRDAVDQETIAALASPDKLGPEHSLAEVVFRRLVVDAIDAAQYLGSAIKDRSDT